MYMECPNAALPLSLKLLCYAKRSLSLRLQLGSECSSITAGDLLDPRRMHGRRLAQQTMADNFLFEKLQLCDYAGGSVGAHAALPAVLGARVKEPASCACPAVDALSALN
jgi:hypothetical protein